MHHLGAEEAGLHLAEQAHARTGLELAQLAGVEVQQAKIEVRAGWRDAFGDFDQQLPARPVLHFGMQHHALDLHIDAHAHVAQRCQPRFVLITQRQMQDQIAAGGIAQLAGDQIGIKCGHAM